MPSAVGPGRITLQPEPRRNGMSDDHDIHNAEEELDGCDLKITDDEATPDEDLPITEGGVE
jgi:hypothetical protein